MNNNELERPRQKKRYFTPKRRGEVEDPIVMLHGIFFTVN